MGRTQAERDAHGNLADDAHTPAPVTGKLTIPSLKPGKYRAAWWNTQTGASLSSSEVTISKGQTELSLDTPSISRDIALYITKYLKTPVATAKKLRQ